MAGKLYTYANNPRAFTVLIAAQYSGAKVDVVADYKHGETNVSAEFLAKFPLGKVPAYETAEGHTLSDTAAIAQYVAGDALTPKCKFQEALVQQYINLAEHEVYRAAATWVYPTYGIIQFNKTQTAKAQDDLKQILAALNATLEKRTFLVGERVTLADITLATAFLELYQHVFDPAFRAPFPHVNRWFVTLVNQPQFLAVIGTVTLAEKQAQFNAELFAAYQKQSDAKKPAAKKEEKKAEKKEEKKVEKKEEKKPAPKVEEEEEPEDEFAEKPTKDPLAGLPASSFVLDAFKRSYSNDDTPVAIDFFWKNFDAQGFSIWTCKYKYPEELKKVFMTCNLIAGFYQRIEKLRKYAFASMCVFGEDDNNQISGLWVWKGQELVFDLSEDWGVDSPSYDFVKLDPTSEETKTLVHEYMMWEGEFKDMAPKKFNQGKIFK